MAKGTLWLTRSYNFVDKNPEIDVFRTLFQKEHIKEDHLAALAGLGTVTIKNMFGGKTRDPRHSTFAKIAGAMNYKYGLVRDVTPNYEKQIPIALEQRREYRKMLAARRKKAKAATQRRKKVARENRAAA